jgi:signal transduction histidine kinase
MERQSKPGSDATNNARTAENPGKITDAWKTYLTGETGRPDLSRITTIVLATALVLTILLTWLPTHLGENLILPGEALFLMGSVILNTRIYKWRPPHAREIILGSLVFQAIIIELCCWLFPSSGIFFQYFVLPFQVYRFFNEKAGIRVAVVVWLAFTIHSLLAFNDIQNLLLTLIAGTLGTVLLVTRYRQTVRERIERERREQLLAELEVSHRQLKAYAEQIEELATIEERNRLAREIHDSLGHYLTAINIQLEKALLQHDDKPDEAMQTISDTKRLASEALQDVRRSVATLREQGSPTFSLVAQLHKLTDDVRNNNRFGLKLVIEGDEQNFSNQVLQTLYRVAQEGLTNIQKYANAQHVLVRLELAKAEARLLIQDDGAGFDPAKLQNAGKRRLGGYGLQGIRERLELVGGNFELDSAPGSGTALQVTAPKDPFQSPALKTLLMQP